MSASNTKGCRGGAVSQHVFEDAGYVTNEDTGVRVYLRNCTRCLLTVATDIPYDVDCPGEPDPIRQKIWDATEGLRSDIAAALGLGDAT